jgi:hypothetical protein
MNAASVALPAAAASAAAIASTAAADSRPVNSPESTVTPGSAYASIHGAATPS